MIVTMKEILGGRRPTKSGRPMGRPRRVTPELTAKAEILRRKGYSWVQVARQVGLPAGTCRRAVYMAKKAAATA